MGMMGKIQNLLSKVGQILGLSAAIFLLLFCPPYAFATPDPLPVGSEKEFWVWDLNVMPPAFRKTKATLRAAAKRSYIFVEDKFWQTQIDQNLIDRLTKRLEQESIPGAIFPNQGIIPTEEKIFAPLPTKINPDERVNILFADLGKYKTYNFDGFFNVFDQMPEEKTWQEFEQHSNEANIIYINGLRQSEEYTIGVIAHELQHLLAYHAVESEENFEQDLWLSETLAEGAMLLTGYFTDQGHVNRYIENPAAYPLVSHSYVQYGPQALYAAFLIDTAGEYGGLGKLTRSANKGQNAIEALYQNHTGNPISFDAIFSNFISYVFQASITKEKIPSNKQRLQKFGLTVPKIKSDSYIEKIPTIIDGSLYPYSFSVIELAKELPQDSLVKVERIVKTHNADPVGDCSNVATPLWKPLSPKFLAIYAIGCEHNNKNDIVNFRFSIFEKPSIFLPTPFRLGF